jgi:hypothetical protein
MTIKAVSTHRKKAQKRGEMWQFRQMSGITASTPALKTTEDFKESIQQTKKQTFC